VKRFAKEANWSSHSTQFIKGSRPYCTGWARLPGPRIYLFASLRGDAKTPVARKII